MPHYVLACTNCKKDFPTGEVTEFEDEDDEPQSLEAKCPHCGHQDKYEKG
jgi:DNA-directed RNA polymerase subunit RPC12/RpoP